MNEFSSKLWRKLGMMWCLPSLRLWKEIILTWSWVPLLKVQYWSGWVVDPRTQGDIFKVLLKSSLMIRICHGVWPRSFSNWSKRARAVQFTHHSYSPTCSMAPQIMVTKANKANKNKIIMAKKMFFWKRKLCLFVIFSLFTVSPELFPFNH